MDIIAGPTAAYVADRTNLDSLGKSSFKKAGKPMCDKCVELDKKILRYERLSSAITDQLTLDGIKELIERMKAQ